MTYAPTTSSPHRLMTEIENMLSTPVFQGLRGRNFHSVYDITALETEALLQLAQKLKVLKKEGVPHAFLPNRHAALYFEQPSTRTRISFETALRDLGVNTLFLKQDEVGLGKRESIADVARTLSRFVDTLIIRHLNDAEILELGEWASVPVVNALSSGHHPCQALADALTILDKWQHTRGKTVAFVGDASNNVAKSLMQLASLTGMSGILCGPAAYQLPEADVARIRVAMAEQGCTLTVSNDPIATVQSADVLYADVFTSMGQDAEKAVRLDALAPYQLNEVLMAHAKADVMLLHCLPAHRGEEITHGVLEAHAQWIFEQAENRHHAQKALLLALMYPKA